MQNNLQNVEKNRQEFKEILTDNLEREVVVFLNSNGGRIYIGIRKDGAITGVDNPDEVQLQIKNRLIKIDLRENEEYGECSLIKAMQKVLDKFDIENVTLARKVGIGPREEKKLVDSKALREAIVNSFAHNEYTVGDTPVFEIFADRFEFTSYGGLIEGMKQEEFFSGVSRPRNPEIMRIFKDLEYVERLGSGIPYIVSKYGEGIFKLMSSVIRFAYWYDSPKISEFQQDAVSKSPKNHLKTTQKPPKNHLKTTPKHNNLLIELQNNPFISRPDLAELTGLTINQVRGYLENLKREGVIRRIGAKKGGYWEIINNKNNKNN